MDIGNLIVGCLIGAIVAGPLVFFVTNSRLQDVVANLKAEHSESARQNEALTDSAMGEVQKNADTHKGHIENSLEKVSLVLDDSAASSDTISSHLEEVQSQIGVLSNMVDMIIDLSSSTGRVSQVGRERINVVLQDLGELAKTKDELSRLLEHFKEVEEKTDAIKAIGAEAEMLALNAAIEAARAGEAGRGFAVVADSMKVLAMSSQETTVDIVEILGKSERVINGVANGFTERGENLDQSIESLVRNFNEIDTSVITIKDHAKMITSSSDGIYERMGEAAGETKTSIEGMLTGLSEMASILTGKSVSNVNPYEAMKLWDSFDQIYDVRRDNEWEDELGHLDGVKLSTLQTDFKHDVKDLDPKKKYLFICRSGGRSTKAAQMAIARGIENVFNLEGGMLEWRKQVS